MKKIKFTFKHFLFILFISVFAYAFTTVTTETDSSLDNQTKYSIPDLENSIYGCERGDCCPVPPCPEENSTQIIVDFNPDLDKKAKKNHFIKYESTIDKKTGKIKVKKDKGIWKKLKNEEKLKLYFDKKDKKNSNDSTEIYNMVKEEYEGKERTVLMTPQSIKLVPLQE